MNKTVRKKAWHDAEVEKLYEAILKLKNKREAEQYFRDLLTESELVEFGNRWKVARMLHRGVSYKAISKSIGMSSTTIARIQKWLQSGKGGYRLMLDRLKK